MVATVPERARTTYPEQSLTGETAAEVRKVLETLRAHYQERLHRRSDDYGATQELRAIERALATLPRERRLRPGG